MGESVSRVGKALHIEMLRILKKYHHVASLVGRRHTRIQASQAKLAETEQEGQQTGTEK